jgi:hypothetical protein
LIGKKSQHRLARRRLVKQTSLTNASLDLDVAPPLNNMNVN